ncbi:hypothetical protein HDV01_006773 [Terramyces sp. JEL0728]|nr:hypothetical protein HDV01_006773 [Terramyces sp. JEL0728]
MKFSVFKPESIKGTLFFLSGLTCNEDNFIQKSCALSKASELGLILVCPDTSPRGLGIQGEDDAWDFGTGAGFYVDATVEKYKNYRMYSYVTEELYDLVAKEFSIDKSKVGIFDSMGGHGALICALRNPDKFKTVSAFAPICNPLNCAWGKKAFTGYLVDKWSAYDATELKKGYAGPPKKILIDQGDQDQFLKEQLLPLNFVSAKNDLVSVNYREHQGYDHSYWFIQTFINDHLEFHSSQF